MSNVLDRYDQAYLSFERAAGVTCLLQCVWVYDRGVDVDGLRRFHDQLQHGRLARRIQRSPLPFGRHRWVAADDHSPLQIVETPRPRAEFDTWLAEQAHTPLDAEHGPGWHLALLPFSDGGAGVSLVISHCLTDGVGLCEALADAATGRRDPISWPGSRRRWHAVAQDAYQTIHDLPAIGRAVVAAARFAHRHRAAPATPAAATSGADHTVTLPTATIFVDADEWDTRAATLGGTANTLLAGLAARLAHHVGRTTTDGSVALTLPVNERTPADTRANAITNVDIVVDPVTATTDLSDIRAATKQALLRHQEVPDERWALLPLVPLLPQRLVRRLVGVATGGRTNVVSSNLGTVDPAANRPDGTDADRFVMKSLYPGVTSATMHRTGGVLALLSGRTRGRVFVSVLAYQPDRANSNEALWQYLSAVLGDFSLTATTGWDVNDTAVHIDSPHVYALAR